MHQVSQQLSRQSPRHSSTAVDGSEGERSSNRHEGPTHRPRDPSTMTIPAGAMEDAFSVQRPKARPTTIAVQDVFVALDPGSDVGYVVFPSGPHGDWEEIPRHLAELLLALGVRTEADVEREREPGSMSPRG